MIIIYIRTITNWLKSAGFWFFDCVVLVLGHCKGVRCWGRFFDSLLRSTVTILYQINGIGFVHAELYAFNIIIIIIIILIWLYATTEGGYV